MKYSDTLIKKQEEETKEPLSREELSTDSMELLASLYSYYGNSANAKEQLLTDCLKVLNALHIDENYLKNNKEISISKEDTRYLSA